MMNKLMEAIIEINAKGTIQEQADKLCNKMYCYEKLIDEYGDRIDEIDEEIDDELFEDLWLMREKYKVRLEDVKKEMCILNGKIIVIVNTIEEFVEFEDFIELFGLIDDEINIDESFYSNLMMSYGNVGKVVRNGLIYSEKYLYESLEDEDDE